MPGQGHRKEDLKIRINTSLEGELRMLVMGSGQSANGLCNYLIALGVVQYLKEPDVGFHGPNALKNAEAYSANLRSMIFKARQVGVNAPKKVETPAPIVEKPLVEAKLDGEVPPPQ